MTGHLRRIRPDTTGLNGLHAVGVVRDVAADDAAHASAGIVAHLGGVAARRAVLHASDDRFDGDQLAIHVTRHWYQRCYDDHVHGATRSRQPLADVTEAEEHQVALTLGSGQPRRLIGKDGIPLLTAQGTVLTNLDRRLAAGEPGLISSIGETEHHTDATAVLRNRITRTWSELGLGDRGRWLRLAGAEPTSGDLAWSELNAAAQSKLIRLYLDTHRPDQLGVSFDGEVINNRPQLAAMVMFNHRRQLDARDIESMKGEVEVDTGRRRIVDSEIALRPTVGPRLEHG